MFKEIYFSVDIETDGPIPSENSMLSLGCAAYLADKTLVSTFSVNLELLSGATPDVDTMAWWETQAKAYAACRQELRKPEVAMAQFERWVNQVRGDKKAVCVCYPAGFDFTFLYWYLMKFNGYSPFSFSAIDIKTYAMAMLKKDFRACTKRNFPKRWFEEFPHTHVAVDDALEQGAMFINMLNENITT